MKNSTKISIILFLLIVSNSAVCQYTKWEKDVTYEGIEFKKIRFREDGKESVYANGVLKQKTIIDGYPCHKEITITKDGKAKFFILSEDSEVAGNTFKKETQINIRNNNDFLIHCLYKPMVQGYHIKKQNYKHLFFVGSTNFQLYPSGKLKFFQPVSDVEIQGIWCKPSSVRGGVKLYESGKLKECTSAKDQTIQNEKVEKNNTLLFDENGKLISVITSNFFGKKQEERNL